MNRSTRWVVPKTALVTASLVLAFLLPSFAYAALTEPCGLAAPSASGYFFANYESVEYTPEGYLVLHFKNQSRFSDGRGFSVSWSFVNDQCTTQSGGSTGMGMPAGVTDWSVRFTSMNHFDLWDDTNNTVVSGIDITPSFPNYYRISFRGSIDGNASFVNSRTFKIYQPGLPPEFLGTAEKSTACPDIAASGYYFDTYEQAEYVDGLLRVHVRFKTPFNDGRVFRLSGLGAIDPCAFTVPSYLANPDASVTPRVRYYSFRMTSPTHWVMWDDENDVAFTCANCQGDIPEGSTQVLWYGTIDAGASMMRTTPYAPTLAPPPPVYEECCSSVAFIPGLKGSVLKNGSDQLWPPNSTSFSLFENDVQQLAIDPTTGESEYPVTVDEVLKEVSFLGFVTPIYSGFTSFLNTLVPDTIGEWEAFPYDWRFSASDAVGDMSMVARIEQLADDSQTGQVTIVAHSMGGLVGKALIKELEAQGKAYLIDSFVMVGSPQLGAPQAVGALLHGDQEGILGGIVINAKDVREVAQNMPGTYDLLPSMRYFSEVQSPVITFDPDSSFTNDWITQWGAEIGNYLNFFSFASGGGVARLNPPPELLRIPEVLRPDLLADSANFHNEIDTYDIPNNIRVVQVAGWGRPTTKTIHYTNEHFLQSYRTVTTVEGDRTVVYPSALSSNTNDSYYFNLSLFNKNEAQDIQHRDLLSSAPIQGLIAQIINELEVNQTYLTIGKPPLTEVDTQLIVSTHSPVVFGVYDAFGNFTGIDPYQDLTSGLLHVTEGIPGSTFGYSGDAQYIFLPKNGQYTFSYKGTGNGPTTVEVNTLSGDVTIPVSVYTDIPTTPLTQATFVIDAAIPEGTNISVDQNGDFTPDLVVVPDGTALSVEQLIALVRTNIQGLAVTDKVKTNLLKKVTAIEKKIQKQKEKKSLVLENFKAQLANKTAKGKIDASSATEISSLLDELVAGSSTFPLDPALLAELRTKVTNLVTTTSIKNSLLKKVSQLEKTDSVSRALQSFMANIVKKSADGKILEGDTQALLDLLTQVENAL